jgi:hypothetical protein
MKKQKTHLDKIKPVAVAMAFLILGSLQSCMFYYKVQPLKPVTQNDIKTFDSQSKYIILHQRDKAWHFSQPLISDSTLYGKLSVLPENRYKFLTTKPTKGNRYIKNKKPNEMNVLEEVHLYVSDSVLQEQFDSGSIKITFSKIQNAEVYVKAKGRTNASWLVPGIGGPILVAGIVGAIIATDINQNGFGFNINMH